MKLKLIISISIILIHNFSFSQGTIQNQYDANSRLKKVTYPNGIIVQYTYDDVGNCLAKNVNGCTLPGNPGPVSGQTSLCAGSQGLVYSINPVANATSYNWTLPPGTSISGSSDGNSVVINFSDNAQSGNLSVKGVNSCAESAQAASLSITVTPQSTQPTGIAVPSNPLCYMATSTLTWTGGTLAAGAQANWYTGNCSGTPFATGQSIQVNPSTTTTYFVNFSGNCLNNTNCAQLTLNVNLAPGPAGTISGNTSVCQGQNSNIYSIEAITGAITYEWTCTDPNVVITPNGPSASLNFGSTAQSCNLRVKGLNACGYGLESGLFITVSGAPTDLTGLTAQNDSICPNSSTTIYLASSQPGILYTLQNSATGVSIGLTRTGNGGTLNFPTGAMTASINFSILAQISGSTCDRILSTKKLVVVRQFIQTLPKISGQSVVYAGLTNELYTLEAVSTAISYSWTYTGTGISLTQNGLSAIISYGASATSGILKVQATDVCGNTASTSDFNVLVGTVAIDESKIFSGVYNPKNVLHFSIDASKNLTIPIYYDSVIDKYNYFANYYWLRGPSDNLSLAKIGSFSSSTMNGAFCNAANGNFYLAYTISSMYTSWGLRRRRFQIIKHTFSNNAWSQDNQMLYQVSDMSLKSGVYLYDFVSDNSSIAHAVFYH
ncbi:MAG: hypothetical protein NTU44_12740 [Bacteroidetes bacterium]|nr:hypothetical protein [Bacteroidota bacterium]